MNPHHRARAQPHAHASAHARERARPPQLPRALLALILLSATASACGSQFDPASLLRGVRLLAIRADHPELAAGDTTTLSALHDPASDVTLDWAYCTLQPVADPAGPVNLDCIQNQAAPYLIPLPPTAALDTDHCCDDAPITMPTIPLGPATLPDATGGIYLPVRVRATSLLDASMTDLGVYRLRYHVAASPLARNQNPRLTALDVAPGSVDAGAAAFAPLLDGPDLPVGKNAQLSLLPRFAAGSAESYQTFDGDPRAGTFKTVTEQLVVNWYATAGSFASEASGPDAAQVLTLDDAHAPAPGTRIDLYAIARDERGGTDWIHRTLVYQP